MKSQIKMSKIKCLSISFLIIAFASCVNLKTVQSYADASSVNLNEYFNTGFNFKNACRDVCLFDLTKVNVLEIKDCNCELYDEADSAINKLISVTDLYFSSISRFAGSDVISLDISKPLNSLQKLEINGFEIKDEQVKAYSNLFSKISEVVIEGYKKRKIKNFIKETNPNLQVILAGLQSGISKALIPASNSQNGFYIETYKNLLRAENSTAAEKILIKSEFDSKINGLFKRTEKLKAYVISIEEISKGHQKLNNNLNRLTNKELLKELTATIGKLREIRLLIQKLN